MAKFNKRANKEGGPYLAASFFCETILEDKKDGALSAIRIIDTITVQLLPSSPPGPPPEIPVRVAALLAFRTGDSPGEHTIRIVTHLPSGEKSKTVLEQSLPLTREPQGGGNLRVEFIIKVKESGLVWMDVFLDGERVTRMPLLISIQPAETVPVQSAEFEGKPDSRPP